MAEELEFLVKNPSRPSQPDFRLRLPAAASVRQLKLALQAGYPGSPEPSAVTVSAQGGAGVRLLHPFALSLPGAWMRVAAEPHSPRTTASQPAGAPLPPLRQAIYAGRVLKDDSAVLGDFVVPVRGGAGAAGQGRQRSRDGRSACLSRPCSA